MPRVPTFYLLVIAPNFVLVLILIWQEMQQKFGKYFLTLNVLSFRRVENANLGLALGKPSLELDLFQIYEPAIFLVFYCGIFVKSLFK